MNIEKRAHHLSERLTYIRDVFADKHASSIELLENRLNDFFGNVTKNADIDFDAELTTLEELFVFMEGKLEDELTPMNKVRIVRHSQRICLHDILENVYDSFIEVGAQEEHSIDPSMVIARATIVRHRGKKAHTQLVMVIGQEKGHGAEFRNGGSVRPWGNSKALDFMKVAQIEGIPIHTYVFTPGSYPIEDTPGAAQQIARNLYEMAGLTVPIVSVISEGGSGGAEAIALADKRLMLSHGYYSVISPEGAAAIQSHLRVGERATPEMIEHCATQLRMTAQDNLKHGYIDRIIAEPTLGARPFHYDFFRSIRQEIIHATDEVVLSVRGLGLVRSLSLQRAERKNINMDEVFISWHLSDNARARLVLKRQKKFLRYSKGAFIDKRPFFNRLLTAFNESLSSISARTKYILFTKHRKKIADIAEEITSEAHWLKTRILSLGKGVRKKTPIRAAAVQALTTLSAWDEAKERKGIWAYTSPKAQGDRAISCPNSELHGCLDMWAPDLFGEFAGVCSHCGHHFPMEYQWFTSNVFDKNTVREFNADIESKNPLNFEGFDQKLLEAQEKTKLKSACITFETRINGIKLIVALLAAPFRGGSVGAAEGTKFVAAAERAHKKRMPFLAYVHGTAGIRIHEGTHGVIQMPRCTVAVRRYIEAGGLYMVVYDTNSYAGPIASFLGCAPYQYAIRSSNIGFAGLGVIKETTGMDIEPHYHGAYKALARGHIQGVWDRREARAHLKQALSTLGGHNLYYR